MSAEMMEINGFQIEVVRTNRRRTMSVEIEEQRVFAVVPKDLTTASIEDLIQQKSRWIKKNLQIASLISPVIPKEYVDGENFKILGMDHRLVLQPASKKSIKIEDKQLIVSLPATSLKEPSKIKRALRDWYRAYALEILQQKAAYFSFVVGAQPSSVCVRTFKSRWGSCSDTGEIEFNWEIIMAPHHIVDYVVVHELCHLHHMNHSPQYWQCVAKVTPDYRACKEWLKYNGRTLTV